MAKNRELLKIKRVLYVNLLALLAAAKLTNPKNDNDDKQNIQIEKEYQSEDIASINSIPNVTSNLSKSIIKMPNLTSGVSDYLTNNFETTVERNEDGSYKLGSSYYVEEQRIGEYKEYLNTYADYYHFDSEKVMDLAKKATNNFEKPFEEVIGTSAYDTNNIEAACMMFCYKLSREDLNIKLDDYGYTYSDFKVKKPIENIKSDLMLSNGLSYSEYLGKVCDMLQIDKTYVLAISYHETGLVKSRKARVQNNFGGLRGKNGFYTYETPQSGIIALCNTLKRYESYGIHSMNELSGKYVYGNRNRIDLAWVKRVKYFHKHISENLSDYFITEQNVNKGNKNILSLVK